MVADDEIVYTLDETAAKLKIARSRVCSLVKRGEIESILMDGPRTRRIPRDAVVAYVERLRAQQRQERAVGGADAA